MTRQLEEAIRRRAYELWEKAGCNGSAEEHWLRAEREIIGSPAQLAHWDAVIQLAIGPDEEFRQQLSGHSAAAQITAPNRDLAFPGGASLSG